MPNNNMKKKYNRFANASSFLLNKLKNVEVLCCKIFPNNKVCIIFSIIGNFQLYDFHDHD